MMPIIGFINGGAMIYLIIMNGVKKNFEDFPMWIGALIAVGGGVIIGGLLYYFARK